MIVKLLTEHHLEFLSLIGGCRGLCESAHVKTPHCWKSHATTQNHLQILFYTIVNDLILEYTTNVIFNKMIIFSTYRGSYMSAYVLLNLLNELGKRDKMRGLPSI